MAELHEESYKQGFVDGVKSKVTEELTDVIGELVKGMHEAIVKSSEYIIESVSVEKIDVQPNRWISVKDRLPEEIGYYLVVIGNEMLVSIDIAEYSENHWHKHDKVLYWQPLPEIPEEAING